MTDRTVTSRDASLRVPAHRHRRRGGLLILVALFQLWVWVTRIANLLETADDVPAAFVTVHAVLYTASIAVAVVLGVLGVRMWREARPTGKDTS